MIQLNPVYPTIEHERAAERIVTYFSTIPEIQAVLLVNSVARGKATRDSCLDISILLPHELTQDQIGRIETGWANYYASDGTFRRIEAVGKYSQVDLHFTRADFNRSWHGWTSGPD